MITNKEQIHKLKKQSYKTKLTKLLTNITKTDRKHSNKKHYEDN